MHGLGNRSRGTRGDCGNSASTARRRRRAEGRAARGREIPAGSTTSNEKACPRGWAFSFDSRIWCGDRSRGTRGGCGNSASTARRRRRADGREARGWEIPAGATLYKGSEILRAPFFSRFLGEARGSAAGGHLPKRPKWPISGREPSLFSVWPAGRRSGCPSEINVLRAPVRCQPRPPVEHRTCHTGAMGTYT